MVSRILCHWLSCKTAVWHWFHPQDSSFLDEEKVVSGTRRPHGLAPGLEEESLVEDFWLTLPVVMCPLLTLCWGGDGGGRQWAVQSCSSQRPEGGGDVVMDGPPQTLWGCWKLFPIRRNGARETKQYPLWISYRKCQSAGVLPPGLVFEQMNGGFLTGRILVLFPLENNF